MTSDDGNGDDDDGSGGDGDGDDYGDGDGNGDDDDDRPIRLTQCCTQFKSPGDKILCVLYLHYNVAFTFK